MTTREQRKRWRVSVIASGKCSRCLQREPRPGFLSCQYCTDAQREGREKRKSAGECIGCGWRTGGTLYCKRCTRMRYDARARLKAGNGECRSCKRPADEGSMFCAVHKKQAADHNRDVYAARLAAGLCTVSGCKRKHKRGRVRCAMHMAMQRAYEAARKARRREERR